MHYLVHTLKNGKIIKYSLETNETSIGRDIVNQIVLNEKSISRRHCKLIHSQGKLRVIDLNSTNGSFINDQRIQESILDAGDTLRLGNIALNVEKDSDDQEPESPGILKPDMVHQNAIVETDEMKGKTIPTFSADATHQDLKIKEDAKKINTVLQEVNRVEDLTRFDMADLKNLKNTVTYFNILYELSRNVAQFMDLSELLDKTLEIIFTVIPAQNGLIVLIDEQTGAKVPVAYLGEQGKAAPDEKIELSLSISNRVLNLSEGILCNDVLGDDNLSISESVKHLNIKSILCAPLIVRNEAIGLIYIDNRTRNARFEEDDLTLLIAIANIVANFIDNSVLFSKLNSRVRMASKDLEKKQSMLLKFNERMRAVVNTIGDAILVIDTLGMIVLCNEAAMEMLKTVLIGENFKEAITNSEIINLFDVVHSSGNAETREINMDPQGNLICRIVISPMISYNEVIGFVCTLMDITRYTSRGTETMAK